MEQFSLWPKIYFGPDPLSALKELGEEPVFLVTDHFLATSGLVERATKRLSGPVTIFDQVTPDPSLELAAQGVVAFRRSGARAIVAFGGGSPMDCAKAVRHFARVRVPLWCIPTTAGTGSEVTSFAVLTDTQAGVKHALVDDALLPDAAVLAPELLAGVPVAVTADTGMDVLTHAAEAYVARGANPFTDAMAEKSFALAWTNLPAASRGDQAARARMLEASCLAGIAFNAAGLGACHALAHVLGGQIHLPHGRLNAILLPQVVTWHLDAAPETAPRYARLAKLCGLTPTGRALAAGLRRLARSLGQPDKLPEPIDKPAIAAKALEDRCAPGDPAQLTQAALAALLEAVT